MQLKIQVHSYCEQPPSETAQRVFKSYPVIIGRSQSCDYVLQDVSKYISSNHALISQSNSTFLLQDTSVNGVYINGSTEPVGKGKTATLRNGDKVTIGDYCLRVIIQDDANVSSDDPFNHSYHDAETDNVSSVNNYHHPAALDHDWTPPSNQSSSNGDWDLTLPDERKENLQAADSDWADWADPKPVAKKPPPGHAAPDSTTAPTARIAPQRGRAPIPIDSPSLPPSSSSRGTINNNGSLDAFLNGAGLDPKQFSNLDDEQVMREVGSLVNQSIEGIMLLLKSRSELKNAIRSDVTMLARRNNNPLKFSQSGQEALEKLLASQNNGGYLDSQQAMKQAVEDLQLHQLAMLDGMRAAVKAMLSQFDPDQLASRLEATNPIAATIPIKREAKLWELFHEKFNGIREEALSDFNELYGREFRKAYEKRIKAQGRMPDF